MSDHIPDVTKMIGETPRTDAAYFKPHATMYDMAGEMKLMERELNVANERIKNLESALSTVENIDKVNAYQDLESANERIKRLEQAGDLLTRMVCRQDGYGIYQDEEDAVNSWHKAKEAKP